MSSSPSSVSQQQQQQQHHYPLGSQERFEEDKKLIRAKHKEIESKRNQQLKQECTFKPETHASPSTIIGMNFSHHDASNEDNSNLNHSVLGSNNAQQLLASRAADVVSRLQQSDVNRRQRLEEALKIAEAKRYQGLTFKPEINALSARTAVVKNMTQSYQQDVVKKRANNNGSDQMDEADGEDEEENRNGNPSSELSYMKVEDRLLREGRLVEARKTRMKMELARQEMALLNIANANHHHHHQNLNSNSNDENYHNNVDHEEDPSSSSSAKPLWQRLQESDKLAKENRERLRLYLENQFSFKPSINHVSAATVSLSRAAAADQDEGDDSEDDDDDEEKRDQQQHDSVIHRLYDESIKQRNERARGRQEEEIKQRSRQYTFAPQVSIRSAQLAVRRAASQGGGGGTFAQRQQHAEACRQEHLSVMKEAMRIKDEKEKLSSKFGGYGKHFDPSEMTDHVKRMSDAIQQRDLKLKELAERSRAAECPFQPATTKKSADIVARKFSGTASSSDVVQRMEMERRASSAARKRHEEKNNNNNISNNNNVDTTATNSSTATSNGGVITATRLQDFLEAQDEHVRRKEEKMLLLRHQRANDEIATCTFRPETNYDETSSQYSSSTHNNNHNQQQHHVSSSASFRSSSAARSNSIGNVDQKVRGMESVRARVALAAKLKQEQADREAKAWGTNSSNSNKNELSVPRCAISSFDYPSSSSQQRQRKVSESQQKSSSNSATNTANVSVNVTNLKEDVEQKNNNSEPVEKQPQKFIQPSVALNQKRQQHQQEKQQKQPQIQHKSDDDDGELEEIEYPQQQEKKSISPSRKQNNISRQFSSSEIIKGAGLLPAHLLKEYESAWKQEQQQQQQQQNASNVSNNNVTSSTPRMSLKKKHHNMHPEMQHVQYYSTSSNDNNNNGDEQGISPYRKKSAAYDLAVRKHLAADSVRLSTKKQ